MPLKRRASLASATDVHGNDFEADLFLARAS